MSLSQNLTKLGIVKSVDIRTKIISYATVFFALAYHTAFLIAFFALNIQPMFYFNIFSVFIFSLCIVFLKFDFDLKLSIFLSTTEVIIHQILAEYFLGTQFKFHYFILLMGIIPFLLLHKNFLFSCIISAICFAVFATISIVGESIFPDPIYFVSPTAALIIKTVNISISVLVTFLILLLFKLIVFDTEKNMEIKILDQTKELQTQNKKIIEIQNNTIVGLSNLVENRDNDTGEHVRRTSTYVELLAKNAHSKGIYSDVIDENYISLLVKAAPMHDVGKIIVPDSILKKPGKLTSEEFEEIKKHTKEGGKIVLSILGSVDDKEYIKMACDIAEYHHERWDGTGYPNRLKGEQIPLSARIMAIADVFDALVSQRCYKEPMPIDKAFAIIEEESGSHFDPALVKLFLELREPIENVMTVLQGK